MVDEIDIFDCWLQFQQAQIGPHLSTLKKETIMFIMD